jgi:hypothetical protein
VSGGLHRFWLKYPLDEVRMTPLALGVGVTALDQVDALKLAKDACFPDREMPSPTEVVVDVDVRNLDQGHVVNNMYPPNARGVWFPKTGPYS